METGKENSTKNKALQLEAARQALAALGKNPRQLGEDSRLQVIDWLYRWGYSSSACIQNDFGIRLRDTPITS